MLAKYRKVDPVLLLVIFALLLIGIVMTYSSSAVKGYLYYEDAYHYLKAELIWVTLGLMAMTFALMLDCHLLYKWAKPILYAALVLLIMVKIPGIGKTVNGATRWIGVGPLQIQPSEVIKLAMVLIMARFLSLDPYRVKSFRRGILPSLALMGLVCGLVMLQPDLGTTLVIAATVFFMLLAMGAKLWHMAGLGCAGLGLLAGAIIAEPYRMRRIFAFLDPWADPSGKGYQTIQSLLALGPGGLFGLGIGQSRQKFLYLPENHTDFIFAMIGEELGFVGASLVVLLFALFIWRGFRAALYAPNNYLGLLAVGLTSLIGIQAMINMGVVSGVLPVTGITLPFISYGGTSLLFTMISAGLLLNISASGNSKGVF
ncbi:MAG: putative lipid II flippase FtsW [Peptococcaceae bacterium]|nr:putative lipid II flippase FtsW [Peptococcaceae bacterium]